MDLAKVMAKGEIILHINDLPTPALIVDRGRLRDNLERMAQMAATAGVKLRPHIKTHKSPFIAHWQQALGAKGVTVATVDEAEVMAYNGINDVFVAYPVAEAHRANRLARLGRLAKISVGIDSETGAKILSKATQQYGVEVDVLIEIDTGLQRSGLATTDQALALARVVGKLPGLRLKGLFTHAGHAHGQDAPGREAAGRAEGEIIVEIGRALGAAGFAIEELSTGSTPSASIVAQVLGVTEIRPGTYVFNDGSLVAPGVATWDQCALSVLATVVSHPTSQRYIVDAGSKSLSKDQGKGVPGFGAVKGRETIYIAWVNEEHGVIEDGSLGLDVGDKVEIIPNHACATVNLFDEYYLVEDDLVLGRIPVAARGHRHLV